MLKCDKCEKEVNNSYLLAKHKAKFHADSETDAPKIIEMEMPKTQVLRFKIDVEFNINGKQYSGREIEVPYNSVPAAVDIVRNAYGHQALEV